MPRRRPNLLALLSAYMALFTMGCVSPTAISSLKDMQSANKGHMNDTSLHPQARDIGLKNYDAAGQVLYNLDGTPLPADTQERFQQRRASRGDR